MTRRFTLRAGGGLVLGALLALAPAGARGAGEVDQLTARVAELVQSPEVEAAAEVVELVRRGLPPPALAAFLEGARLVPRIEYAGVLGDLLRYRRAEIRGRALAALTSIGGASATQALLRALDDPERRVRRLAVVLSSGSSAPEVLRVRAALQEREPDLFEEDDDLVVSDEPETPAAETPAP